MELKNRGWVNNFFLVSKGSKNPYPMISLNKAPNIFLDYISIIPIETQLSLETT